MTISDCLKGVVARQQSHLTENREVRGLSIDSRLVRAGYIFFAIPGTNTDGHRFLNEAVNRGAVLVIVQDQTYLPEIRDRIDYLLVDDVRLTMAHIARRYYGDPGEAMHLMGVTGTNGKTTTCFFMQSIFEEGGVPCGLLTTVKNVIGNQEYESINTTEESPSIYYRLASLLKQGIRHAVMEVSSHGLALNRVEGIQFDTAVVTNLVPEHMEFHGTFQHYFNSKKRLVSMVDQNLEKPVPRLIVANGDDPEVMKMIRGVKSPVVTFGTGKAVTVRGENPRYTIDRSVFTVKSPWGDFPFQINQPGLHNVYNALGAVAVSLYYGLNQEAIEQGLMLASRVPGRWERLQCGQPFEVIIDFAHNWHGLDKSLSLIRHLTPGKVITVFGCGGERDTRKRPLMGEVAARWSDLCILTADNPRHEDPLNTIQDALAGITQAGNGYRGEYRVIPDRREAIRQALEAARQGDTVFLAGKGPERSQIYSDYLVPHNDLDLARTFLEEGRHGFLVR